MINVKRIHIINSVLYLLFLIISAFFSKPIIIGIAIGGALSVLNFFFIETFIGKSFINDKKIGLKFFFYFIKLTGLLSLIYVSIVYIELNAIAFVIGLSILFISIVFESILRSYSTNADSK